MIRARALHKHFHATKVHALRGVDLDVAPGEFVALMGPSGSGKSCLLQILGTLDTPDQGELTLDGQNWDAIRDPAAFRANTVGFVFQAFHLLPTLSVAENVQIPMLEQRWKRSERMQRATDLLQSVGLGERAAHLPHELSGGERQRVALARALANRPRLLLADEPTGNLDSANAAQVMNLLRELHQREGLTVLMVTHDAEIALHAQRIIRLRDGRITGDGISHGPLP